jgi:hypothetical protein
MYFAFLWDMLVLTAIGSYFFLQLRRIVTKKAQKHACHGPARDRDRGAEPTTERNSPHQRLVAESRGQREPEQ